MFVFIFFNKGFKAKEETFQTNNVQHMEWFRKYQCAAFRMICATVSNTKNELRFYESYIFLDECWPCIINTIDSNLYTNQTLEVDKRPQIKERMVLIRRLNPNVDNAASNRKYIESQNVFESSLSQDVTKIDLSSSYVRTAEEVEHQNRIANYQPKTLMLEKNSVNDHEVMATLCGVIQHLFEEKITPIDENFTAGVHKPKWVVNISKQIANQNNDVHINIRIFFVTVIDNCSKWFGHYSDIITPAIVKFLVDWTSLNGTIDALTVFLLVDLLEWSTKYQITTESGAEEQELASRLIENLMRFAYSQKREVFRRNLELIRNLMERWHKFIKLSHQLLYEKISDSNTESKSNLCGIHLNGIVLANELVPWTDELKIPFLKAILVCLHNNHTDVYQPAAQVLGMVLNEIIVKKNNGNIDHDPDIKSFVDALTDQLKKWERTNEKKFMYVLFYIDKYYLIKDFIMSISKSIASCTSDMKKFYLQMFLARVNDAESRDIEMILLEMLNPSHEHQHQLVALHIFNKALPKMPVNHIKHILPRAASFHDAKQRETRDVVYEIMMYIRENDGADQELKEKTTEILLKGLNDVDKELQTTVFKYWNDLPELPPDLNNRVLFMFDNLYSRNFLKYGVQLLIDLKSNNLKNPINTTLPEDDGNKYTEYDINVNWKSQDSSLRVPLFTESQQKQIINGEIDPTQSYLRATQQQTLHFDPTLDPSTLQQSSSSFSLQSQSSLLIGGPIQVLDRRSQRVQSEGSTAVTRNKFSYLRERILRNKDAASREKALSAVRRREYKKTQENQQQQRKEGQVTLYRRYRYGDFPDFYINSLAFLLPLQVLVKLDATLARNTFVEIMNAVYKHLLIGEKKKFMEGLAKTIVNIIRQPNNCDPMLFSALTEIILTNAAELKIEPGIATLIQNANDMMINAILLLENQLITADEASNQTWGELANMYYSLSEYDVASSIFSEKISADKLLSKAIESESNGDYQNALKSYMQLLNKSIDDQHWNQLASDFSFQSFFNCYEVMGRWEDLEKKVEEQLREDSQEIQFEQLWDDEWNKKYLLPHYIRSEVRIIDPEKQNTRTFLQNVVRWLRNPTKADFIKKHFGEQLMILHMANKDYLDAKVFSIQYLEGFLDEWNAMSVLSEKMRNNKLMDTRRVAEIHKYADLLSSPVDDTIIAGLSDRWQRMQINKAESTQMWEALISYRLFVTEQTLEKFPHKTAPIYGRLTESMFDMQLKLNEIAVQQQNTGLSNTVLRRLDSFQKVYGRNNLKSVVQFELATVKQKQILWMNEKKPNPQLAFGNLTNIWLNLQELQDNRRNTLDINPDIQIKVLEQLNEITDQANKIVLKCDTIDDNIKQKIAKLTGGHCKCFKSIVIVFIQFFIFY